MKKYLIYLMTAVAVMSFEACSPDKDNEAEIPGVETPVPFCTYAATYRDETLARIVELTPDAKHLTGEGLTSGRVNEQNIASWLKEIGIFK